MFYVRTRAYEKRESGKQPLKWRKCGNVIRDPTFIHGIRSWDRVGENITNLSMNNRTKSSN